MRVRRDAEKLKHADRDIGAEVDDLQNLMAAVTGVMTISMRFFWGSAAPDRVDYLRSRLTTGR